MSSLSIPWLTSLSCSTSIIQSSNTTTLSLIIQWLRFIFLSPCPQRALLSSIDLIFLLILASFSIQKLLSRLQSNDNHAPIKLNKSHVTTTLWFKLSLILTSLLALSYLVFSILAFTKASKSSWEIVEAVFRLIQAITHIAIAVWIAHQKRFESTTHPKTLRAYWFINFIMAFLFSVSSIIRLASLKGSLDFELRLDDIFSLITLPIATVLLIVAIRRSNGIIIIPLEEDRADLALNEPLLGKLNSNVARYASASWLSKATFYWMTPLLTKGYKTPLKIDDIPTLSPDHLAERTSKLFESNWPKDATRLNHPVRTTLALCFWKDVLFTAMLALIRLAVMYVGPVLLQRFVDFVSGNRSSPHEGYYLVLTLLAAKLIEDFTSHQFNFQSQKVGMLIRSSLITALYKKGLRLSSSSRQAHGLGQIVNFMAVDAQQLSDMVMQLHNLWLMPCQISVALVLLYIYIGPSALAALVTVVVVMCFVMWNTKQNNIYQYMLMMMRDSRLKATSELLNNMRVIKFQAWEDHFHKRIESFRDSEFDWLWKFTLSMASNMVILWSTPLFTSTLVFGTALLLGFPLTTGIIFTAQTIFRILNEPIRSFPQSLMSVSQAINSLERLDRYLTSKELVEGAVEREEGCGGSIAVEVKDGIFGWDDEGAEVILKNLNLMIKKGELAAVVGTVGSGKSSLLASILGEMRKVSGKVRVCGTTAYVAQTSWIQNGTIQDNILFDSPMNHQRYSEVIRVCCLEKDLEMMEFGDQTEIGERGINLSGGQKQRIQLARAVYQDCDVYLLDDVFSAVDAQTGSEIFKECVRGALKDKTILLVTHQVDFLHNADLILVMRDGMIVQSGKYGELLESGMDFGALVAAHETSMELVENSSNDTQQSPASPKLVSPRVVNGETFAPDQSKSEKGTSKLIEEEEKETGQVSCQVYKTYTTEAYGWCGLVIIALLSFVWQMTVLGADFWLAYETGANHAASFNPSFFISIYAAIAFASFVLVVFRNVLFTFFALKTAQIFFKQILHSILHAPMSFFDTTPSGRILSRASTDQTNVDVLLPFFINITMTMYVTVLAIIGVTCMVAWPTFIIVLPLAWCNLWYRGYYLATSRELTRLDSITKAPVIHHFSESVAGVMTIRSFKKQATFCQENYNRVNANLRMDFHNNGSNEWLGFRLEIIGNVLLCSAALFMVTLPSNAIKPELVGLSLSYGLSLSGVMFYTVYMSCFVENRMVSVERIKQFVNIPSEAPWKLKDSILSPNWPTHGDVDLKDLQVRYRPNTPLILKGITLSIRGGEKIGVVGRTGSGKSTLIQVMFRVMEPSGGKIVIDGVDISKLGLHDLRSRYGIIPQDPVLFEGTVRGNIDPIGLYSDEDIWKSLERCQLKDVVAAKPEKLDASVVDGGDNWSVGQRQLLCLGRVMLKRSRILFMDEATASVDSQTDGVIQRIIREDFAASTIISIAHRIPTVMDCDKVLVIDAGKAKEFDAPSRLLERPSLFSALVQEYSNRSSGL